MSFWQALGAAVLLGAVALGDAWLLVWTMRGRRDERAD